MPRGDGTGPMGNGPIGRGRNNCQPMNFGRMGNMFGFNGNNSGNQVSLADQATRLEQQAANLRQLDKQNSKTE